MGAILTKKYNENRQSLNKIILYDHKIEIYDKYTKNNNPDDLTKEIRRDFCLPSKRRLSVTYRHIIYATDL